MPKLQLLFLFSCYYLFCGASLCQADRKIDELNAYQAAFEYLFQNNGSSAQQNAKGYFIKINEADPDESLLLRFREHKPPVKKGSLFPDWRENPSAASSDNSLLFSIENIEWIDDNNLDFSGSYFEGPLSGNFGGRYHISKKGDHWEVSLVEGGVIS